MNEAETRAELIDPLCFPIWEIPLVSRYGKGYHATCG
jgi:hypothetical protein